MSELTFQQYLDSQIRIWTQAGLQPKPSQDGLLIWDRRKFSLTKFGMEDTVCVVADMQQEVTPELVTQFGGHAFQIALRHKFFLPRGFGAMVVAYPLMVVSRLPEEMVQFLTRSHSPKHYASVEFPVIFDRATRQAVFYQGTPMWGAAYYSGLRKQAERLFTYSG